jgi:hypothetical protein
MRRLICVLFVLGLLFSVGCKDEKVIAPKDVPPPPKGPPMGSKAGGGGEQGNKPGNVSPPITP